MALLVGGSAAQRKLFRVSVECLLFLAGVRMQLSDFGGDGCRLFAKAQRDVFGLRLSIGLQTLVFVLQVAPGMADVFKQRRLLAAVVQGLILQHGALIIIEGLARLAETAPRPAESLESIGFLGGVV